jgi:hypothetical protein
MVLGIARQIYTVDLSSINGNFMLLFLPGLPTVVSAETTVSFNNAITFYLHAAHVAGAGNK